MKHLRQMIGEIIHHCPRLHHTSVFISVSRGLMRRVFRRGGRGRSEPVWQSEAGRFVAFKTRNMSEMKACVLSA